jgi:pimeloyl-ACP methyl ester carboxylesterase
MSLSAGMRGSDGLRDAGESATVPALMPRTGHPVKTARGTLRVVGREQRAAAKRPTASGPAKLRKAEITLHGRCVAYRTGGWGPLIVLIHGLTSNSATWDRVLPALAQRYTVLAPDLLGHGRSDKLRGDYSVGAHANTIRDLMDALGYSKAMFVGHSLGGGVALQFAYQYPKRIERLALVAPGGFGKEVTPLLRAASLPGSGPVLALAAAKPVIDAGRLVTRLLGRLGLHGSTDLEEIGRAYALLGNRDARKAFLHTLRSVVDLAGQCVTALDRIDVEHDFPALIVWGGRDRVLPAKHGEQAHQLVPNTYLALFENAGHFPHREEPERFVAVLDEFLAREWRTPRRGRGSRASRAPSAPSAERATAVSG